MAYIVIKELKAPTKVSKGLFLYDFLFIVTYLGISIIFRDLVYQSLQIPFFIFSAFIATCLVSHSKSNPGKRFYQALFIWQKKEAHLFVQMPNISKDKLREDMANVLEQEKIKKSY